MARTDALCASIILFFLLISFAARAQTSPAEDSVPQVYLVTVEPGDAPWERFGHDMIVVGDANDGAAAVNYGVFDFDAPNFIGNFIRGKMTYWMEADDWQPTKQMYSRANRSMWLQELNLSPRQRIRLVTALHENSLPENKYYRYDYFRNNCTTKVRDAINAAVDGEMYRQLKGIPTTHTYRDQTRIGMASYFWLYTGLELAMGPPCDVKLSAWEECYLPAKLMENLKQVTIDDGTGKRVPLLKPTIELYKSTRTPLPEHPPAWWPWFLLVGLAVGSVMLLAATRDTGLRPVQTPRAVAKRSVANDRRHSHGPEARVTIARIVFLAIAIIWSLICSLASLFMIFLWSFTDHAAGYRNENLLIFSPFSFLVLLAAIWAFRWKSARWFVMIPLLLAVLDVALKPLPWFREWNWELISLALPAHAGLALGVWILAAKRWPKEKA